MSWCRTNQSSVPPILNVSVANMPQEGAIVISQEEKLIRYEEEKGNLIGILHDPDLTPEEKLEAVQEFLDLFPKKVAKRCRVGLND